MLQSDPAKRSFSRLNQALFSFLFLSTLPFATAQTTPESVSLAEEDLLNVPTIDLSKVVVTAGGFAQAVKDAPASISVVTQEEIAQAPFRDVTDAIADIPGVVITGGGANADISIRGMGSQYTLMMVDGKRQNSRATRPNSDGAGIEQGWIPPLGAIERIEVIRGPMSSRYGSDAMGGVINIITKKVSDRWMGNIRTDATIQNDSDAGHSLNTELYLSGPLIQEKLGLQVYGKYSHRKEDEKLAGQPKRQIQNFGGKLTFVPMAGQTFELEYGNGSQKRNKTEGKSADATSEDKYKRTNYSARYLGEFDHGIMAELFYAYEKNDNTSRQMIVKNTEVSGNVIIPIANHTVTLGGQFIDEKLSDNNNRLDSDIRQITRKSHAIFLEDEWWLFDNFAITAGLRYDHDENYGSHYSPRLYGVWNINDAFTLKGGVSTGYKTPAIRQAVADWGAQTGGGRSNGLILGNPDLKPEKSTNYEIGLSYTPHDQFNFDITGFYTKFKDKLQNIELCRSTGKSDDCVAPNGSKFFFIQTNENIDTADLKGIELAVQWQPIDPVTLKGSYTWTKTKQTSGQYQGAPLNRIPEHLFNIHADWQINPQANVWAKVSFRGKETSLSRQGARGTEYDSYTLMDIGGSYQLSRDVSFYAGIYNIANKHITDENYGRDLDGRRYWMGVDISF
ncbi:TonB-dependent receptor [Ignatzschineria ureiclastica]|uniref:TonB-dependent receptor n=1 Tax=Ignatzschineria ureiclastica TaxID=472582 RepID=A0A2U2AHF4_9GAMM|nr:TonB-dependent receptor [Ignatzschineria ureiclastica]PWD82071.1 TonB-dependent receptor [Ignatzschineria ureiclastica]GGZ92464.1 ligand-gated channel protein [Ignatzschineria ureiclastica]